MEWTPAALVWQPLPARAGQPACAMLHTPVTNAQYQAFVDDPAGYADPRWWGYSPAAAAFRAGVSAAPETAYPGGDLPRTNVCWYEAVAYARWLAAVTGADIRLPTDAQWQYAAQGDDSRRYPWGNAFEAARCAFNRDAPAPVGAHPAGASPFGLLDMAGNVWEWTLNDYATGSDDVTLNVSDRALRGGSWWGDNPELLTCAYRSGGYPDGWSHDWGFRLVRLSAG